MDKELEKELREIGLHPPRHAMITEESIRQLGATCRDCGSRKVVYFISKPLAQHFDKGAYCYPHLLNRCKIARIIPYPIELELLNKLKEDIGIPITQAPTMKFTPREKRIF